MKNGGASARNKFRSYELVGVRQKAVPSASSRQGIPRVAPGGKGRRGGEKRTGYSGRDGFALSVYVLRSISLLSRRLPLRPNYSGALSCYRGLWPGGMYPGRLPYPVPVFVGVHAPTMVALASVCADARGWPGVCLRVHYVDCWSRPLRRTQRTSKGFGGLKRVGVKTVGKRSGEERKKGEAVPFPR